MKSIDHRSATWADLQTRLTGLRLQTLVNLQKHGPCTTRALAAAMAADVLAIRPRVTELIQLGFVQLVPGETQHHEGVYRVLSTAETQSLFAQRRTIALSRPVQRELPLTHAR